MTRAFTLLKILLLSLNLFLPVPDRRHYQEQTAIVREHNREKRRRREQKKFPPPRKKHVREKLLRGSKSTRAKDHRYSNQKMIRRMYRNT